MNNTIIPYSIISFEEKDAAALAALEALCFSLPWSAEQYQIVLRGSKMGFFGSMLIIGMQDNQGDIIAYLSLGLHHSAHEFEVYNIAVRPDMRRHGLAKKLLFFAFEKSAQHGITRAVLEVRPSNTSALALYAKLGFIQCAKRKKYYEDTGEDALVLECFFENGYTVTK